MDDLQETPLEPPAGLPSESGQDDAGTSGSSPTSLGEELPPETFAKAKEARSGGTGSIQVEFTSERVSAEHIEIAGQVFNQHFNLTAGGMESVQLSAQHFKSRNPEELEICEEELVFDNIEIEKLQSSFEATRILILAGEPEGGKGSLGLLLGSRMTRTRQWRGLRVCQGLGSGVQVDLEKVANDEMFSQNVVMFEDALAGENSDLKAFLRTMDSLRLTTLQERLRKNSVALLLTVTSSSVADSERRLENYGILVKILPPASELLIGALRHFSARLPHNDSKKEAVASFLTNHEAGLARELKTVPRVARFVQEYLVEVVAGNLSIRQALGRMDDLSQWLTSELGNDLDAQAAVLAIAFGSTVPPAGGVPWLAFDDLRRRITGLLREELRIPEDKPSSPPGLGRDFLHRARAYVADMPSPLTDLVRFRDERYPQRLWQALLGPARELATLMIPLLRELALGRSSVLREIAASALGRLGQISPIDLAMPLLQGWTRQGSNREELVGGFLQGSVGSGDETYKNFCITTLRDLVFGGNADVAETAVRSLSFLGMPEPVVPIRELCGITQERLPVQFDVLSQVALEVTAKEEEVRQGINLGQVASALQALYKQSHLLLIAALVPEDRIRLLGAVQYALAGVLFSQGGDPGPVFRELLARMKAEPVKIAPIFAYLFLHRHGLIELLDRYKWRSGAFSRETSRFLLAARPGEREPKALHDLLESIFSTLATFPGFFRFLLEQRFFEILKSWSQEGCEEVGLRPVVIHLLYSLRTSKNVVLGGRIERFLETDPDFIARGSRLQALARDVLDGKGLDAGSEAPPRLRHLPAWMGRRANNL